ncbi:hypothetical protein F4778DRAFT_780214 [Xylariomycetidae sp. FL2044]|nr:hypothetical protein F4778DRAFT_780214 [Xylariomycetidae sp. FL2044]
MSWDTTLPAEMDGNHTKKTAASGRAVVDAVRVTVPVALRFLHELQLREETAHQALRRALPRP